MKYYHVELFDRNEKEMFSHYLKINNIRYEASGCYNGWHFSILMSPDQVETTQSFLDSL